VIKLKNEYGFVLYRMVRISLDVEGGNSKLYRLV